MQETSLHAVLKDWYTQEGDHQEVVVDGYKIDVISGTLLIEIQTRNFSAIKNKLDYLIKNHVVRIVYPVPLEKWIVRLPAKGHDQIFRRKSPKRGRVEDIFIELVRIPELLAHPNLSFEVLFTREEEIRCDDGKGSWRRKGVSIVDRRLIEIIEHRILDSPNDFRTLLPQNLPQLFTNRDLAINSGISVNLAAKMSYCLRAMGILSPQGKSGRAILYQTKMD